VVLVVFAGAWLCGLLAFVRADGHFEATLPRRKAPPAHEHNLSSWEYGPTVRASSYFADWGGQHHPLFLVDGRTGPLAVEKWASAEPDRHPWIEILWREEHDLARVVLQHAGTAESSDFNARRYAITCLTAHGQGPSLAVDDNRATVATHALSCAHARGIRVAFEPNDDRAIVRVYEVETWGQ
jgi:hypothetical protein